jgi:hypothetical protein
MTSRGASQRGQAAVELVAVLPLLLALVAGAWQLAVAGQAVSLAGSAARAAARAQALGGDPTLAARRVLPTRLERGLRVRALADGAVRVSLPIPGVLAVRRVATVERGARFAPQGR